MDAPSQLPELGAIDVPSLRRSGVRTGGYITSVHPNSPALEKIVNPRRGSSLSIPLADWKQQVAIQDDILAKFGLDDLVGCTTSEMDKRPVPHVFESEKTEKLTRLYERWLPHILGKLMPLLEAPIQPFNKTSRLGWPHFGRPDSKKQVVVNSYEMMRDGDYDWLHNAFIIMNVRLQAEPKDKEREFLFVDSKGAVYSETIRRTDLMVTVPEVGERVPSRTRLVFNLPVPNLVTQVLDTALHNAMLKHRFCKHNMYDKLKGRGVVGGIFCFDVKHFERFTASCAAVRFAMLGGMYAEVKSRFRTMPFLCPADSWKKKIFLWPDREAGYSEQYASGDSAVAAVQKEILLALYAEFARTYLGMPIDRALQWALDGGDIRLTILNYGDDNATFGEKQIQQALFSFLKEYLEVEEEEPPKFLGFLWTDQGFRLGVNSYLTKTYLNERAPTSKYSRSAFRKFPCYGWVLKRKVYRDYGVPEIARDVFLYEERLLAKHGIPWSLVEAQARAEQVASIESRSPAMANENWILGKDYMMSPEEKVNTGFYEGLRPTETGPMLKQLLSQEWLKSTRL